MVGRGTIEVAKTVMEVADVAWTAVECCHKHHNHEQHEVSANLSDEKELESLRSENQRLRNLLEENLKLLQNLSESPCLLPDCPPDLHDRLMSSVDSTNFLNQIKYLQHKSIDESDCNFPFKVASEMDLQTAEMLINVSLEDPSWWVWVTDEMIPSNVEERSTIDNENYVIVSEEHVVEGVANFMAKCIMSNPKAQKLTPEELQKSLTKALGGTNKLEKMFDIWHAGTMIYTLSTWGLALVGLYKTRAVVKLAAKGVYSTSKLVMKAL